MPTRTLAPRLLAAALLSWLIFPGELPAQQATVGNVAGAALGNAMRDRWVDHIFWVRQVVQSTVDNNQAALAVADQQSMQNVAQIAQLFEPYYGKAGEGRIRDLLTGHVRAVVGYLKAAQSKDKSAIDGAYRQLLDNAKQIGAYLGEANPRLKTDQVAGLVASHAGHHKAQIDQALAGNWTAEANTWHVMREHVYALADTLTLATIQQFPAKIGADSQPRSPAAAAPSAGAGTPQPAPRTSPPRPTNSNRP